MDETSETTPAEQWERAAQIPMLLLSLVFVAAYAWPVLDPGLPAVWHTACDATVWATWGALVVELAVRFRLAEDKWQFVRRHPLDVASVVLPALRPLRLLRLLTLLSVLNRYAGSSLRGRVGAYLAGSVSLIVLMASLSILEAERGQRGPIQTFGDALWWSLTTITTVGYGDMYPVTVRGRCIAVGLMVCGIGVLGVVTASFASWLLERVKEIEDIEEGVTATAADVHALRAEVLSLRAALEATGAVSREADDAAPTR